MGRCFRAKPENIAYQNHLYSIGEKEGRDNRLEDYFAELEGDIAPRITDIIKNKERPKTCEDKAFLLYNMGYIFFQSVLIWA